MLQDESHDRCDDTDDVQKESAEKIINSQPFVLSWTRRGNRIRAAIRWRQVGDPPIFQQAHLS